MELAAHCITFCVTYCKSRFDLSERGASLVEYALLIALVALVCVGAVGFLGSRAKGPLSRVGSSLA